MTEQEQINQNLQRQIDAQNARIDKVLTKVDTIIGEMRDRDNQRAEDIRELRQKQDADMKEIRTSISNMQNSISDMGKHVRNLSLTAMAAIGAMVVTVVISILNK